MFLRRPTQLASARRYAAPRTWSPSLGGRWQGATLPKLPTSKWIQGPAPHRLISTSRCQSLEALCHAPQAEPGWEEHLRMPRAFTRPLIGMELWLDQNARLKHGMGQFAIGVEFTSTTNEREIQDRLKEAVIRLRFDCPLVAATMEQGLHHPEFRCWVYTPLPNVDAARSWVDTTVHYIPAPVRDPASFLQSTVESHEIPYILADNSEQYFRVYLTRPNNSLNAYFLSLHTSHSIVDARPALNVLSLLLEWMTRTTSGLPSVDELAWGAEQKNLPPGPVTVTRGPREDWSTKGTALVERYLADSSEHIVIHSHGLPCDTSHESSYGPLKVNQVLVKFTADESASIARALRTLGFSFSVLLDAATAVAVFEQNPVPAEKASSAFVKGASPIALTDRLPPSVDRRRHVVSCLALAPYRIDYAPLAVLTGKARLLAAMRSRHAQSAWWLANPCLPHLFAALAPRLSPTAAHLTHAPTGVQVGVPSMQTQMYTPGVTNVGRVENYIAPVWPLPRDALRESPSSITTDNAQGDSGTGQAGGMIRVGEMHLAVRMGSGILIPLVHAWSMQGQLSVFVQAPDVWDKEVLQELMDGIVRQILFVMDQ